jgi:hypothetical protein
MIFMAKGTRTQKDSFVNILQEGIPVNTLKESLKKRLKRFYLKLKT